MLTNGRTVTVTEAADRLRIRPRDIYRLIDHGKLPARKGERGRIVIPEAALPPRTQG